MTSARPRWTRRGENGTSEGNEARAALSKGRGHASRLPDVFPQHVGARVRKSQRQILQQHRAALHELHVQRTATTIRRTCRQVQAHYDARATRAPLVLPMQEHHMHAVPRAG